MSSDLFSKLLGAFGDSVGVPDLATDEDRYCVIKLDDRIVLVMQYEPDTESVVLYVDLGPYPEEHEREVFASLLQANCLWAGTGGATLGVNGSSRTILLGYRLSVRNLELEPFKSAVESLVNTAEFWMNRIGEMGRGARPAPPEEQEATGLRV